MKIFNKKIISYLPNNSLAYKLKNGFTIIEVSVVFLLILGVTFLIIPASLNNTKHAKLISKWTQTYSEIEYMFSAIKAQQEGSIVQDNSGLKKEQEKNFLLDMVKPYLRITSEVEPSYKQHYMNTKEVTPTAVHYFDTFYYTSLNEILGLKWINKNCLKNEVCAIMSIDINGTTPPNTWGYDIYGINLLKEKIEPIGKNTLPEILKLDCSKNGTGASCSYYYLIGGKFD